jgi:hypothetical protein
MLQHAAEPLDFFYTVKSNAMEPPSGKRLGC